MPKITEIETQVSRQPMAAEIAAAGFEPRDNGGGLFIWSRRLYDGSELTLADVPYSGEIDAPPEGPWALCFEDPAAECFMCASLAAALEQSACIDTVEDTPAKARAELRQLAEDTRSEAICFGGV
jgi:hypothetical protein